MAQYEVEIGGKKYQVDAPDEQSLGIAVKQLQESEGIPSQPQTGVLGGPSAARSFGQGVASAALFGFEDEIAAGLAAARAQFPGGSGASYSDLLGKIRQQQDIDVAEYPKTNLAGMGVGIIPAAMATGPAAFQSAAPMATRVATQASIGGGMGAAAGFGTGEGGIGPRAENALRQGVLGAAVGGAIPVAASGASAAYRRISDRLAQNAAARGAGTTPEVARIMTNVLGGDDTFGPQGAARMARAGQEAMLADAGPNAQALLDTAVQRVGPAGPTVRRAVEERAGRGAQDLTAALDRTLGAPQGVQTLREGIRTAARPALNEAYETAYSLPINYASEQGKRLEGMVRNRVPANVIATANNLMRINGEESAQILARVDDAGNAVFETLPDVRQLDYITRALRQASESGEGAGALGGQTQLGAAYQNLSREIRGTLREAVPEYGAALDTAADPISRSQAVKFGSTVLSKGVTRDEVAHEVAGMSQAERQAALQGVRSNLDDKMASVEQALTDTNMDAREAVKGLKELSSRSSREKMTALLGEDQANQLFDEVDRVSTSFELRAALAQNSKTAVRQATEKTVENITAPGVTGTLAKGEGINAVKRFVQQITGSTPEALEGRQQDIYRDIAELLTRPAAQSIPAFNAMTDSAARQALNQVRADQIRRLIGSAAPVSYPSGVLLNNRGQQ